MSNPIILVGGGGHCKSVIDVIEQKGEFQIAGILDIPQKIGTTVLGYPIIGSDSNVEPVIKEFSNFHITVGYIYSNEARVRLFMLLKKYGVSFPVVASGHASVSKHATIEEGSFIGHRAVINSGAVIGMNSIINTGAIIEHDSRIGAHSHISTLCAVNADCIIGESCFLSSHAVVNRGLSIAAYTTVYSGAVVTRSFTETNISLKGIPANKV